MGVDFQNFLGGSGRRLAFAASEQGALLGIDPNRIAVAGASSGGNSAAVVAQDAARQGIRLRHQALLQPMMRFGATTRAFGEDGGSNIFSSEICIWFWNMYLVTRGDAGTI